MIRFDQVSVTYADAATPTLRDLTFEVPEGELCLVVGPTGSGKSTLLRSINGLVPHFTGGRLTGLVTVDGRSIPLVTLKVDDDAPAAPGHGGVLLGRNDGIDRGQSWDEVAPGDVFTQAVIELDDGEVMVVKAVGAETEAEQAELDAALDLVLSTMTLPN